jgi:hypothetical protein
MSESEPEVITLDELPDDDEGFYACEEGDNDEPQPGARAGGHVLALWLDDAFRKWGVRYKYVEGWETRGRPATSGGFAPNGLLIHHTGTRSSATSPAPSLGTVTNGRTDLKGPLCQISTDYNGLTYIVAAGRANHAGTAKAAMGNPSGDGNAMYLGNEVQTSGLQDMPDAQYNAVVLTSAAIMDHFGYTSAAKTGLHHTTSTSGKWDLGAGTGVVAPYPLTSLRAAITARLQAGPPGSPPPPAVTLMPYPGHQHANSLRDDWHVGRIQLRLKALHFYTMTVDSKFGPGTEAAVKAFQRQQGIAVDGFVGRTTWARLRIPA